MSKDGWVHKQHLQDNKLGMPCRSGHVPAELLCIIWKHPAALQIPCLEMSERSGRRRCWPGCVTGTLQRRCVLPVGEPSQVLAISRCVHSKVHILCMPSTLKVLLAAHKRSAMKHCCGSSMHQALSWADAWQAALCCSLQGLCTCDACPLRNIAS